MEPMSRTLWPDSARALRRWCAGAVLLGASCIAGCGGLRMNKLTASVQRPGSVALYFSVETRDGDPVGGLEADAFRIYEDGALISPYESKQVILNPEVAVVHYVMLLVDLSGSITESGSLHDLVAAASRFSEKVTKQQQVGIYGFSGSPRLKRLSGFTSSPGSVTRGLSRLSTYKSKDPSTNLNGAVVEAIDVLDKQLRRSRQPLRFGTLVVFTDGTDRAHRVKTEEMTKALDEADINVFAIGLGQDVSKAALSEIGRNGFVQAESSDMQGAFEEVADRIENASRKFYLLSYCSPSRAGQHELEIEASARGQKGSIRHKFDAKGFGPGCDPKRTPKFRVERILLDQRRQARRRRRKGH